MVAETQENLISVTVNPRGVDPQERGGPITHSQEIAAAL
jgi:hypothetical protein